MRLLHDNSISCKQPGHTISLVIRYDTIRYDTILHYTTYTTLHCTTLHYTLLYYTILYYTLHYTLLYYTTLHYTILYYTIFKPPQPWFCHLSLLEFHFWRLTPHFQTPKRSHCWWYVSWCQCDNPSNGYYIPFNHCFSWFSSTHFRHTHTNEHCWWYPRFIKQGWKI